MAKRVTHRMAQAANMLADGIGPKEVAVKLGVAEQSVYRWMRDPDVLQLYRDNITRQAMPTYAKASKRIDEQLDNNNPWIVQGAAREVLSRFGPVVMGTDDREVVVKIDGMPTLGMPTQEALTDGSDAPADA